MNNKNEERYVFYRMATEDFRLAHRSIAMMSRYKRNDILMVLIRDAIVAYARPFSGNKGNYSRNLSVPKIMVPSDLLDIHRKTMQYRNQVFAHTDIPARDPDLGRWAEGDLIGYPISTRGFHFETFRDHADPLNRLIVEVSSNLVAEIRNIEKSGQLDDIPPF